MTLVIFKNSMQAFLRYKEQKVHAKVLAERWKSKISKEAYESLMNF